jgi:hypothetical protein
VEQQAISGGITVTASASVTAQPDVADIDLAVEWVAESVRGAVEGVSAAADAVRTALSRVDGVDVTTHAPAVWPETGRRRPSRYEASVALSCVVADPTRAGDAVEAAVSAGGNAARVGGVRFRVRDAAQVESRARHDAYASAHRVASEYADLAGRSLGPLAALVESGGAGPYPVALGFAADMAESVRVDPVPSTVTVTVTARWELG